MERNSNEKLNSICRKYAHINLQTAVSYLYMKARDGLRISKPPDSKSKGMMTTQYQLDLHAFAEELSEIDIWTLMNYLNELMPYVRKGKVVSFQTNITEDAILTCVVDEETSEEELEKVASEIDNNIEEYGKNKCDFSEYDLKGVILTAFEKAGIGVSAIIPDKIFYL